jgi:hypothetical protein
MTPETARDSIENAEPCDLISASLLRASVSRWPARTKSTFTFDSRQVTDGYF